MMLSELSPTILAGTYSSTTGSTGEYFVVGFQASSDPTTGLGQPVSLAIAWHSIGPGPSDQSWHWTSGLSGQISIQDESERLALSHAMIASCDFPGICSAGNYIDKLNYERISDEAPKVRALPTKGDGSGTELVGTWIAPDDASLTISSVTARAENAFGFIEGQMVCHGNTSPIYGVTDLSARSNGLSLQALALVGLLGGPGGALAIARAGTLDFDSGLMTVVELVSAGTTNDATYVQTRVSEQRFVKQ
jgi:hypothetical protein